MPQSYGLATAQQQQQQQQREAIAVSTCKDCMGVVGRNKFLLAGLLGTGGASHLHRLRWPSFSTPPCFVLSNQRTNLMLRLLRPFSRPNPAKPVTLVRACNLLVTFLPALYRVSPFRPPSLRQVARNPSVQSGRRSRLGPSGGALRLQIDISHHCSSITLTNLYRNLPILPPPV